MTSIGGPSRRPPSRRPSHLTLPSWLTKDCLPGKAIFRDYNTSHQLFLRLPRASRCQRSCNWRGTGSRQIYRRLITRLITNASSLFCPPKPHRIAEMIAKWEETGWQTAGKCAEAAIVIPHPTSRIPHASTTTFHPISGVEV